MSRGALPAPELPRRGPGRLPLFLRAAFSLGLLAGLAVWLDAGAAASRLASMQPSWVLAALAVSGVQVAVLAWRWSFTARRLGVDLPWPVAWREYYLSIFLNQILPGGVLGDVARAWRQVRSQIRVQAPGGPAVRAVVFERLSAQVVMTTAARRLPALPAGHGGARVPAGHDRGRAAGGRPRRRVDRVDAPAVVRVVAVRADPGRGRGRPSDRRARSRRSSRAPWWSWRRTWRRTCWPRERWGVETPLPVLLPLVAPVLMSMLIPVTVAGWGLREGAAAVLWGAVGLTATDGVVVSIAYGLLVLAGSAPGAVFLAFGLRRGRSRPGAPIESPVEAEPRLGGGPARPDVRAPAASAQVEVEQHVVAELELPARGAQGAVERRDGGQGEGVAARPDEQRRDGDVQARQHAGAEEP